MKELLPKDLTVDEYLFTEILKSIAGKEGNPKFWEEDANGILLMLYEVFHDFECGYSVKDKVESLQAQHYISLEFVKKYIANISPREYEHQEFTESGFYTSERFRWDTCDLKTLICAMLNKLYPHGRQ